MARKTVSSFLVLAVALTFHSVIFGLQDSPTYAEEYDLFTQANEETNAAKREALTLDFVKKFKASVLDPNISYLYAQSYASLRQGGKWQQLGTKAEQFLRHRPNDSAAMQAATEAYQQLGDTQKLVTFGSKLYQDSPNANTAYFVAKAYQSLNDQANFQKWARRTAQHDPKNLQILVELSNSYWGANNMKGAAEYAGKALQAADSSTRPDSQTEDQWTAQLKQVRGFCYRALGEAAYVNQNTSDARKNFEASVEQDPSNDFSHYRLGLVYWGAGHTDQAILSLAKASVLSGGSSKEARTQLNQLYRSTRGSLDGLPSVIQKARADLESK